MKQICFIFILFVLLAACTVTPAQEEGCPSANLEDMDNPIDSAIPIPTGTDISTKDILLAQEKLIEAWRNEMIHAYHVLRPFIPEQKLQAFMDAQMGFELYLRNSESIYLDTGKNQFGNPDNQAEISLAERNSHKILLYRQRTYQLIGLYQEASSSSYRFLYPQKIDTALDREGIPVTFTEDDFNLVRQEYSMTFTSSYINYFDISEDKGFLEINETAGRLERYLDLVLGRQYDPEKEFFQPTDDLIFVAAASNTEMIQQGCDPYLKLCSDSPLLMKEHIQYTAEYLFGDHAQIDFENLKEIGGYSYDEYFGMATVEAGFYAPFGYKPVVVDYENYEDFYDAIVVFLYWDLHSPTGFAYLSNGEGVILSKQEAKEYCINILPRYKVRIDVRRDSADREWFYFVSKICLSK